MVVTKFSLYKCMNFFLTHPISVKKQNSSGLFPNSDLNKEQR
jgi:hypothetical protein